MRIYCHHAPNKEPGGITPLGMVMATIGHCILTKTSQHGCLCMYHIFSKRSDMILHDSDTGSKVQVVEQRALASIWLLPHMVLITGNLGASPRFADTAICSRAT